MDKSCSAFWKVWDSLYIWTSFSPLACSGTRVSHKSSRCYQQLSEGHVSLWVVTAALHYPDGNGSSC